MSTDRAAQSVKAALSRPTGLACAVGTVRILAGKSLAEVSGITVQPIRVDKSSWSTKFVERVAAGAVDGKRVIVLFSAGQAIIDDTLGG